MGPPALAAELTDRIIDFLHDDKRALDACALTHPTWLTTSRFHLFSTITLDDRLVDWAATLDLLSGARVLSRIRSVRIVSKSYEQRVDRLQGAVLLYQNIQQGLSESKPGSSSDVPTPHLPTIHLRLGQGFNPLQDGILPVLSQISDKVTHLELSRSTLSNRDDLWPFVSSFPNLRSLEARHLAFVYPGNAMAPPPPGLRNIPLSRIRIDTKAMGFIVNSLLEYAGVLTSLEEFGILYEDVRQTSLVAMAEAIQGNVKVLRFSAKCHAGTEYERHQRPSAFDISMRISQSLP
jgi:hypothetical protein